MFNFLQFLSGLAILFSLTFSSCSPKLAEPVVWQEKAVTADAETTEYPELSRYLQELKTLYYIGNDRKNLYLVFKTYDKAMMRKLMLGGLEIALDTSAGQRMRSVIRFPIGRQASFRESDKSSTANRMPPEGRMAGADRMYLPEPDLMEIRGFVNIPDGTCPPQHPSGIQAKVKLNRGDSFVYEAVIPFSTFYRQELGPKDKDKMISLTIHLPGLQPPGGSVQAPPHTGGQRMGQPGMGRGQGVQSGDRQRPDTELMSREFTMKKRFKLQYNAN